jgi:hypothetical protein
MQQVDVLNDMSPWKVTGEVEFGFLTTVTIMWGMKPMISIHVSSRYGAMACSITNLLSRLWNQLSHRDAPDIVMSLGGRTSQTDTGLLT